MKLAPVAKLEKLLERRNNEPDKKEQIDREIRKQFERTRATFILDMAGFSISVQKHGIIHHLAKIHRMRVAVEEVTRACRGRVVKFEADNAFVTNGTGLRDSLFVPGRKLAPECAGRGIPVNAIDHAFP